MSDTAVLSASLGATQTDSEDLRPYVVDLDDSLKSAISVLAEVKSISDNLSTLDDDLGTVSLVLTALSPVPVVGEAASATNTSLKVIKDGVHPVRTKANQFEAKVEPIRTKLQAIEAKVKQAIDKLDELNKKAAQFQTTLDTTYSCLQKKDATTLMTAEDEFSAGVNPEVVALNKLLTTTTTLAESVETKLEGVEQACRSMESIAKPIDDVLDKLKGLSAALDPIEAAIKQKITIPYGLKVKGPWYAPWKWKVNTVNFTFSVKDILDGVNTGIGFVNDALMAAARKILNALNLNLPEIPNIPGLDALEKELDHVLGFIGQLGADVDSLGTSLQGLFDNLTALEASITKFDIKC